MPVPSIDPLSFDGAGWLLVQNLDFIMQFSDILSCKTGKRCVMILFVVKRFGFKERTKIDESGTQY